ERGQAHARAGHGPFGGWAGGGVAVGEGIEQAAVFVVFAYVEEGVVVFAGVVRGGGFFGQRAAIGKGGGDDGSGTGDAREDEAAEGFDRLEEHDDAPAGFFAAAPLGGHFAEELDILDDLEEVGDAPVEGAAGDPVAGVAGVGGRWW